MIFHLKELPKNPIDDPRKHRLTMNDFDRGKFIGFNIGVDACTAGEITSEIILEWLSRLHDITGIDTEVVIELDKFLEERLEK